MNIQLMSEYIPSQAKPLGLLGTELLTSADHSFICNDSLVLIHGICDDRGSVWKESSADKCEWIDGCFGYAQHNRLYFWYNIIGETLESRSIFAPGGVDALAESLLLDLERVRKDIEVSVSFKILLSSLT